jgi:hypothetical protein
VFFRVKRRGFLLLIVWVLMLLAGLSALNLLEGAFNSRPDSHTIVSVGWAGYIISDSFNQQQPITYISASWTVPTVNVSAGNGYSSVWIGIGGQLDKTLIQVGTEHNVINGEATYSAWYEMLPAYSVKIDNFVLSPGDQITAAITIISPETNEWNIQLNDITNGEVFNQNFFYNSTKSSGEWIVERSTVNGQISNLADFGALTFNGCHIHQGNTNGDIRDFSYSIVHMTNQQYDRLATTSSIGSDNASFTVTYQKSS